MILRTLTLLAVLLISASSAAGQGVHIKRPYGGRRSTELDLHAGAALPHNLGVAAGGRFNVPIIDNGFISTLNNAVYIPFGVDLYFTQSFHRDDLGVGFGIPVTGRWQFNFNDDWSAYGEVGANIFVHSHWFEDDLPSNAALNWYIAAVGGKYHFNPDMSLTLRVGSPYAAVGIDIRM